MLVNGSSVDPRYFFQDSSPPPFTALQGSPFSGSPVPSNLPLTGLDPVPSNLPLTGLDPGRRLESDSSSHPPKLISSSSSLMLSNIRN